MRSRLVLVMSSSIAVIACGSSNEDGGEARETTYSETFEPPPLPDGYERLVAPVIEGIGPGGEVNPARPPEHVPRYSPERATNGDSNRRRAAALG